MPSHINAFPYIGGKHSLLDTLLGLIPPHTCYVEPFGGAASLLLNKEPVKTEVYNDLDGNLVNLFMVLRDHSKAFLERFKYRLYSREWYKRDRDAILRKAIMDPVERAAATYYLLQAGFGGKHLHGWGGGRLSGRQHSWNPLTDPSFKQMIKRLQDCYIEALDFRECIARYDSPETLFYCDPPYFQIRTHDGFTHYYAPFTEKDHRDLAEILHNVKGKILLTYDDHPFIRQLYADWTLVAQPNRSLQVELVKNAERKTFPELILKNW